MTLVEMGDARDPTPIDDPDNPPSVLPPRAEPERPSYQWEGWTYVPLNDEDHRRGRALRQQRLAEEKRQERIRERKERIAGHRSEIEVTCPHY
jgi:hypothetical protein